MKNLIGIDIETAKQLSERLNQLFEEFYNDTIIKIDEIAERILTLEGIPLHTFSDYLKKTKLIEEKNVSHGTEGIKIVVSNLSSIIALEREILSLAEGSEDEGTISLMSDYISQTEKTLWMLNAYLK